MSLLLVAIGAGACGVLLGRWVGWVRRAGRTEARELPGDRDRQGEDAMAAGKGDDSASALRAERPTRDDGGDGGEAVQWDVFPCALGDVVVRVIDGAEAWLAGALVLREDAPAAVLFVAPDAAGERAIYARPRPSSDVAWLSPVAPGAIAVGAEPPSAIEIEGARFERTRRLPLRVQRVGSGAPDLGATALLGEYSSPSGDVAVVLIADGVARAWRGRRLSEDEIEVWPGGEETRAP